MHILLAEDNIVNQKVAAFNIQRLGHTLAIAGDGQKAVDLFKNEGFDLILMDIQMPEMDGYEAAKAIREIELAEKRNRCIIICLTAFTLNQEQQKCFDHGMDDFLPKPFHTKQLEELLEKYFPDS